MSFEPSTWPFVLAITTMLLFLCEWAVIGLWRYRKDASSRAIHAEREARGVYLLREWMSADQLRSYDQNEYFDVVGSDTATTFRIHRGTQVNIEELGLDGRALCAWCIVPDGNLVAGDVMLAQKIGLESDELATLATAIPYPQVRKHFV